MSSPSRLFDYDLDAGPSPTLALQRRADEIAAEEFERAERRRVAFAGLKSDLSSPAERIRAWPFDEPTFAWVATIGTSVVAIIVARVLLALTGL